MSNKLKRKTTPKKSPQKKAYERDWKVAENCYSEVFTSFQLICFSALYSAPEDGGFDFTKQKLKNYNKFLHMHHEENIEGTLSLKETSVKFKKVGFNCEEKAVLFPYRAKIKMAGPIKPGKMKIALASVETAIESYLILAVHTLRTHYQFGWDDINNWWKKCVEVGELYAKGMTDDWVIKFIKDEMDLEIER